MQSIRRQRLERAAVTSTIYTLVKHNHYCVLRYRNNLLIFEQHSNKVSRRACLKVRSMLAPTRPIPIAYLLRNPCLWRLATVRSQQKVYLFYIGL